MNEVRGQLPEGMQLQVVYNRAEVINRTVDTVRHNLFEGALLVAAVVFPVARQLASRVDR